MSVIERTIQVSYHHRVLFARRVFECANPVLRDALASGEEKEQHKAFVVLDESLARAQPQLIRDIEAYFTAFSESLKLVCLPFVIEGGERTKNSYFHVSEIHSHIDRYHIDRHADGDDVGVARFWTWSVWLRRRRIAAAGWCGFRPP